MKEKTRPAAGRGRNSSLTREYVPVDARRVGETPKVGRVGRLDGVDRVNGVNGLGVHRVDRGHGDGGRP